MKYTPIIGKAKHPSQKLASVVDALHAAKRGEIAAKSNAYNADSNHDAQPEDFRPPKARKPLSVIVQELENPYVNVNVTYNCKVCNKNVAKRNWERHYQSHAEGQKFICNICGKGLTRHDHLLRHVRTVHPGMEIPYKGKKRPLQPTMIVYNQMPPTTNPQNSRMIQQGGYTMAMSNNGVGGNFYNQQHSLGGQQTVYVEVNPSYQADNQNQSYGASGHLAGDNNRQANSNRTIVLDEDGGIAHNQMFMNKPNNYLSENVPPIVGKNDTFKNNYKEQTTLQPRIINVSHGSSMLPPHSQNVVNIVQQYPRNTMDSGNPMSSKESTQGALVKSTAQKIVGNSQEKVSDDHSPEISNEHSPSGDNDLENSSAQQETQSAAAMNHQELKEEHDEEESKAGQQDGSKAGEDNLTEENRRVVGQLNGSDGTSTNAGNLLGRTFDPDSSNERGTLLSDDSDDYSDTDEPGNDTLIANLRRQGYNVHVHNPSDTEDLDFSDTLPQDSDMAEAGMYSDEDLQNEVFEETSMNDMPEQNTAVSIASEGPSVKALNSETIGYDSTPPDGIPRCFQADGVGNASSAVSETSNVNLGRVSSQSSVSLIPSNVNASHPPHPTNIITTGTSQLPLHRSQQVTQHPMQNVKYQQPPNYGVSSSPSLPRLSNLSPAIRNPVQSHTINNMPRQQPYIPGMRSGFHGAQSNTHQQVQYIQPPMNRMNMQGQLQPRPPLHNNAPFQMIPPPNERLAQPQIYQQSYIQPPQNPPGIQFNMVPQSHRYHPPNSQDHNANI